MNPKNILSPCRPARRSTGWLPQGRMAFEFEDGWNRRFANPVLQNWDMDARSLKFVTTACGGELLNGSPDTLVHRTCTDSRAAQIGDLFFALPGDRFDGHTFVHDVAKRGVTAVVVQRSRISNPLPDCAVIVVDDTRRALGQLAAAYRRDFSLPIIAVGGSNGKTTTKELIAAVLRQKLASLWSEASFNNDIGVPLTLLRLEKKLEAAVIEVGTNHPGEIAPLAKMIQPRFGVITNIGREHLEFFGDLDGVADEEGALAESLPEDGMLLINGDNELSARIAKRTRAKVIFLGMDQTNDWQISDITLGNQGTSFRVTAPDARFSGEYHVNLVGRHQAVNALFAIALGAELDLTRDEISRGLVECEPPKMRLQLWEWNGVRVLDDAYNANADSMIAALQTLCDLPCKGRRVAVLGDMAELGASSEAAHAEVGRRAVELGVEQLFVVGKMAGVVAKAARDAGLNRVLEFEGVEAVVSAVKQFVKSGDVLLMKASRAARLERIGDLLRESDATRRN
jgi:UDP-N-acetylmuramoyl-tripeptide--D-alanyl-D-alanine ligase